MSREPYVAYTRRFFDRWSPLYDLFARPIGFAYEAAARASWAAPGARVLDVCTGTGEIARRCARRGADVTAIDFTPSMLERARAKAGKGVRFALMDARRLAFEEDAFDAAVVSFALHDMPRAVRAEALREAARVAKRVVVLDYEPPRKGIGRRIVLSILRLFETAYLDGFARHGVEGALSDAGLRWGPVARPLPGFFALRVAERVTPTVPAPRTRSAR